MPAYKIQCFTHTSKMYPINSINLHETMLNDITLHELSIFKVITQSPSLVSTYDTLVHITTLENAFLNYIGSHYLMANKTIKWSTIKFLGSSLLTHQGFHHLVLFLDIYPWFKTSMIFSNDFLKSIGLFQIQ